MDVWNGILLLNDGNAVKDIHLSVPGPSTSILSLPPSLRFLAYVDASKIPLHLIHGPRLDVWTTEEETESWFSNILLSNPEDGQAEDKTDWWHTALLQSPLAILAAVEGDSHGTSLQWPPRPTEVLFYASRNTSNPTTPPTPPSSSQGNDTPSTPPCFSLRALTLCSALVPNIDDQTPPSSPLPGSTSPIPATFLALPTSHPEPPPMKRKSLHDTFAEAELARKRAKHSGGASLPAAVAKSMPTLKELNAAAAAAKQPDLDRPSSRPQSANSSVPLQTRPLSRSPSIVSATNFPPKNNPERIRSSNLSHVTTSTTQPPNPSSSDPTIEAKNKDLLSRLTMAGMRLHGLSQSRTSISRRKSIHAPSMPPPTTSTDTTSEKPTTAAAAAVAAAEETSKAQDEEYKLIYHTTMKSATFTFRKYMASTTLQPHIEVVRETVDRLLALFCGDALAEEVQGVEERVTPGGRREFGSAGKIAEVSPWGKGGLVDEEMNTPGLRRKGK